VPTLPPRDSTVEGSTAAVSRQEFSCRRHDRGPRGDHTPAARPRRPHPWLRASGDHTPV